VKLGCQHVRCNANASANCRVCTPEEYIRTTIGILTRLSGSTRLSTICIAAIEVTESSLIAFCSCSKVTLFPLPGRHPFVPEHAMGPWYGMWSDKGCLMQARQGAAGLTVALYCV
jgi:hypothetical protein